MKKIVCITILLLLTGCHKNNERENKIDEIRDNKHYVEKSPTIEMKYDKIQSPKIDKKLVTGQGAKSVNHINREMASEVAKKSLQVTPISTEQEYIATVKNYSKDMNKVIETMTVTNRKNDVNKKLLKVKKIAVKYEAKVQDYHKQPTIKKVDHDIKLTNEKYIQSLDKIASGIEKNDVTLKENGYAEFTEGHQYLSRVHNEILSIEEGNNKTDITTKDLVNTTEEPSVEIVLYKATADGKDVVER